MLCNGVYSIQQQQQQPASVFSVTTGSILTVHVCVEHFNRYRRCVWISGVWGNLAEYFSRDGRCSFLYFSLALFRFYSCRGAYLSVCRRVSQQQSDSHSHSYARSHLGAAEYKRSLLPESLRGAAGGGGGLAQSHIQSPESPDSPGGVWPGGPPHLQVTGVGEAARDEGRRGHGSMCRPTTSRRKTKSQIPVFISLFCIKLQEIFCCKCFRAKRRKQIVKLMQSIVFTINCSVI